MADRGCIMEGFGWKPARLAVVILHFHRRVLRGFSSLKDNISVGLCFVFLTDNSRMSPVQGWTSHICSSKSLERTSSLQRLWQISRNRRSWWSGRSVTKNQRGWMEERCQVFVYLKKKERKRERGGGEDKKETKEGSSGGRKENRTKKRNTKNYNQNYC